MTSFGGLFGLFFFFWEHQKWAYFLWLVLLTSFSRSSASVSLSYPLFSHTPEFPALFWFTDNTQPPVLGYCLYFPLCASVGNSAFPVSHLVGWSSVDFVQTVGSAWGEGLVLDLQSLPIVLSSFKKPADNSQPPSATPATHKANHWHSVAGFYGECSLPLLFGPIVFRRFTQLP